MIQYRSFNGTDSPMACIFVRIKVYPAVKYACAQVVGWNWFVANLGLGNLVSDRRTYQ